MLYRGPWSSGTTYLFLDTVSYQGSSYVATTTVPSGQANPSINASWSMVAQAGAAGAPGSQWYTGSGAPAGATGVVGDWYLDSVSGNYYSKTGASTWTLQGSLKGVQGNVGPAGPTGTVAAAGAGTALLPSISFAGDPDTGFWNQSANQIGVSTGGVTSWIFGSTGTLSTIVDNTFDIGLAGGFRPRNLFLAGTINPGAITSVSTLRADNGSTAAPAISFTNSIGTGFYRQAPDQIGVVTAGVGSWVFSSAGYLLALTDNTYDIGSPGALRPRTIYAGTSVVTPLLTMNGPILFSPDANFDIGASGATRPRSLYLSGNAFIGGGIVLTGNLAAGLDVSIAGKVGFYGGATQLKQAVSGSRAGNAALASLLTALSTIGLVTDSSTA